VGVATAVGVAVGVSVTVGASLEVLVGVGVALESTAQAAPVKSNPASAIVAPLMTSDFFCIADTLFHPDRN